MKRSVGARFVVAIVAALALVGSACGSDKKTTSSASGSATGSSGDTPSLLGELNSAAGEPVKVGLITTGVGQGFDTSIDVPVAKATAKWINEYRGGIGGRPIEIVTCEDKQDPGVAADCGNEMVQQDVVAVFYGASGQYEASWRVLNEAGVPTFILAVGSQTAAKDATNTFILNNSLATTIDGPLSLAKQRGAKIVSVIAVDVPAATVNYTEGPGPQKFKDAGIELDLIPVPLGTPDMTVQTQQLVKKNPDGVVNILGTDAFCIAALSGLRSAGYTGAISANEACITDNTRKAIPLDYLKGLRIVVQVPFNDPENESTKLFNAVMDKYAGGKVPDRKEPEAGFCLPRPGRARRRHRRASGRCHARVDHRGSQVDGVVGASRVGRSPHPLQQQGRSAAASGVLERRAQRRARQQWRHRQLRGPQRRRDPGLTAREGA